MGILDTILKKGERQFLILLADVDTRTSFLTLFGCWSANASAIRPPIEIPRMYYLTTHRVVNLPGGIAVKNLLEPGSDPDIAGKGIANPTPCLLIATFYDRLMRVGSSGEYSRGKSETENISDFAWLFWKWRVSGLANCKQHLYPKIGEYLEKNYCQHAGNT